MIFVSGRFRSGTTALWNAFRHVPSVCAYYEPFHDNLVDYIDADPAPDPTHKGVSDYFSEYRPILQEVRKRHAREFGVTHLCMGAKDDYPALKEYLSFLAEAAKPRLPVFKFVRADFRLPWLRHTFPEAKVVCIIRNPRNSWLSIISKSPPDRSFEPWLNTGFDLTLWSANLAKHFAFLGTRIGHSYGRHYCLWRLSTAVAHRYGHLVIDYDTDFLRSPKETICNVFEVCGVEQRHADDAVAGIVREPTRHWEEWVDRVNFDEIEATCNAEINSSGLLEHIASGKLDSVGWPVAEGQQNFPTELVGRLCVEVSEHRSLVPQLSAATEWATSADAYAKGLGKELEGLRANVNGLTEWATSADTYAKSLLQELEGVRSALEAERVGRTAEREEASRQIAGLTEWATSADAYAKSLVQDLRSAMASHENERAAWVTELNVYRNHWILRLLRHFR